MRARSRRLIAAGIGAAVAVGTPTPAGAHHGDANTVGTLNGDPDAANVIRMADIYVQEWSVWDTWAPIAPADFDNYISFALESLYDDNTDLIVNAGARYSVQDVSYLSAYGTGNLTQCNLQTAAIYGANPHRVCDKKVVWIDLNDWNGWSSIQRKYVAGHEFGHSVGLRHSNAGVGVDAAGNVAVRTHPDPEGTVMRTNGFGTYDLDVADRYNVDIHY